MNQNKNIIDTLTKDEMIQILIEDRLTEWVFASNYNTLEDFLLFGWSNGKNGYESYTEAELKEELEEFDEEQIKDYLESRKKRINEQDAEGGDH